VIDVALYEPEIPPNAGNVARLCAATGAPLHLIGRMGFSLNHPDARRSGLDYWKQVQLHRHITFDEFRATVNGRRICAFTTKADLGLWDVAFGPDDVLLFGPESRGLPDSLLSRTDCLPIRIPMVTSARSLNVGTSAGIALYEGLRQIGWRSADQ